MADFWVTRSGQTLFTLEERKTTQRALPLNGRYLPLEDSGLKLSIISGELPRGMRLVGANIEGTPFEVVRDTKYEFVVRAELNGVVSDRTYNIIITGPDEPVWVTAEDLLPVGNNNTYYIIDSSPLDFQLEAYDPDTIAGDNIEFYIQDGDGELPPGIQLTTDGRLVGVVEPILALEKRAGSGKFDSNNYGSYPYDFGIRPSNGFDSFFYDTTIYDKSIPTKSPKKLNRFYEFIVTVSDGDSIAKRRFRIYVVGDDFLRSDNTIMQVANGVFTADNTYVRIPIWLTPRNFGYRRANNYVTLFLDTLDPNNVTGLISYQLQSLNDDGSASILPPGLSLDTISGEIAGRVPYQPAVTKEYKFTVRAIRQVPDSEEDAYKDKTFVVNLLGEVDSTIAWNTNANLGIISANYVSTLFVKATTTVPNAKLMYTVQSGSLPPGLELSLDGEIIGKISPYGQNFYRSIWKTSTSYSIGDVIKVGATKYRAITAHTSSANFATDSSNWEEFSYTSSGLTVFDNQNLILDGNTTAIDRKYTFTINAQDQFGYSAITRTFTVTVTDPDKKLYSNIFVKPFLKSEQRTAYDLIIGDPELFDPNLIYRPNDPNFGLQRTMKMLVYAGIESKQIQEFVAATAKNHKRKTYRLGEIKTAVAKKPGTNDILYEVVYVDVIDPAEKALKDVRKKFRTINPDNFEINRVQYTVLDSSADNTDPSGIVIGTRRFGNVEYELTPAFIVQSRLGNLTVETGNFLQITPRTGLDLESQISVGNFEPYRFRPQPTENTVKVDSNAITIDGANDEIRYISNISHMRDNIKQVGETERNFLPLWMRTAQEDSIAELGFVNAIPLCYCKPGTSKQIKDIIDFNQIKFNQFNFDIDRYIIDATEGNSNEQYILFANYQFNV